MADLRRTIDEIRSLMQDEVIELTAQLEQLASEFAQGCREANERLRKCEEFLNQGLRAEALHFAELAPNLLDQVGMLDFPELAEWSDFLADNAATARTAASGCRSNLERGLRTSGTTAATTRSASTVCLGP